MQSDCFGTHGAKIVQIHEYRAPACPLGIAFHHGRKNGITRHNGVCAGHGSTVVTEERLTAKVRLRSPVSMHGGRGAEEPAEHPLVAFGVLLHPTNRPPHVHVRLSRNRNFAELPPAQPTKEYFVLRLDGGFETQNAVLLCMRAGRPHQRRSDTPGCPGRLGHHQPAAGPPAQVNGRRYGSKPDTPKDLTCWCTGNQDNGSRIIVNVIPVAAGEQSLLGNKNVPTNFPVGR